MKVKQLIKKLKKMPKNAEVTHVWDGEERTGIEHVYLNKAGRVVTADWDQVVYSDKSRPIGAPTKDKDPYWSTPDSPEMIAIAKELAEDD